MTCKSLLILFVISTLNLWASSTYVEDCGNGIPKPIHVAVEGCDYPPCRLKRGSEIIASLNFTAPEEIKQLQAKTVLKYLNIDVNYPLPQPDACKGLVNTHCPLEANEPAIYKVQVPITKKLQKVIVTSIFTLLYNKEQKKLLCFKMKLQITD